MRTMLKSKIHRATVTDANLEYQGSVTIDPVLMRAGDILPYERVEIYNCTNGERFATYCDQRRPGARRDLHQRRGGPQGAAGRRGHPLHVCRDDRGRGPAGGAARCLRRRRESHRARPGGAERHRRCARGCTGARLSACALH
jgi:hypothetical protein